MLNMHHTIMSIIQRFYAENLFSIAEANVEAAELKLITTNGAGIQMNEDDKCRMSNFC